MVVSLVGGRNGRDQSQGNSDIAPGIAVLVIGLALILVGGRWSQKRVKDSNALLESMLGYKPDLPIDTGPSGPIPRWLSLVVLTGWALLVVGAVLILGGLVGWFH